MLVVVACCSVLNACGTEKPDLVEVDVTTIPTTTTTVRVVDEGEAMMTMAVMTADRRAGLVFASAVIEFVAAVDETTESSSVRSGVGMTTSTPAPTAATSKYLTGVIPPELVPFFDCVVEHESLGAGLYGAVNLSGKYRGAYQMDRSFWRSHAPEEWKYLADSGNWETAPAEVQDATAVAGYFNQGPGAWSGPGGAICVEYRI